jgi:hypothetical protein
MNVDDLVHFSLREWTRMSMSPTSAEVERAKSQTKAGLLLTLDGSAPIADDVSLEVPIGQIEADVLDWTTDGDHGQTIHAQGG